MEKKKLLAGWGKICPTCNIGRKYPDSFIGKTYIEVYGSEEPPPKKTTD
jgi:hypothetical protein